MTFGILDWTWSNLREYSSVWRCFQSRNAILQSYNQGAGNFQRTRLLAECRKPICGRGPELYQKRIYILPPVPALQQSSTRSCACTISQLVSQQRLWENSRSRKMKCDLLRSVSYYRSSACLSWLRQLPR